jgi:GNAT superfamily N-acetyltransferase
MNPAMNAVSIRLMTRADFPFADSLRAMMGWNQTLQDWERFLSCEPDGCFVAEWDGAAVGTATTSCYGSELGWIGMLLVHPDHRRRGIGSALLQHGLDQLHRRGVRCVKLDATPLGQPVYERVGFQPEQSLTRWERQGSASVPFRQLGRVKVGEPTDLQPMVVLDRTVFGQERGPILAALAQQARRVSVVKRPDGRLEGFGMLREGTRADYLGPLVACSSELAAHLVGDLLCHALGRPIFWDVLNENRAATALAGDLGFSPQRSLLRMFHGANPGQGDVQRQFAIVDPALG